MVTLWSWSPPLPHWGNQNWELKQFTQGYPPHHLQVKGGESRLKCKADECQSPFPSMPLTGEQWKMRVVMTYMSLSGEMKRTMEEGVCGSCCLSRNGWWAPEERNGIHHGATSWSQYENFKEPGDSNWGVPLVASMWGKAHYQGEPTETTCRLRLVVLLLGTCWTSVGLQCSLCREFASENILSDLKG